MKFSDTEEPEDFVYYGTPLEATDEDAPAKIPRLDDQYVRDKQGRRRFHGAFTGGFSAGYFNTVDTKEGWTPSTFVSSKSERAEQGKSRPEDYMDEEDFEQHGIAPKLITATSSYATQQTHKRKHASFQSGTIPGEPVLEQLLHPSKETIGEKLLRKLGWKPGQGIGPRVSKREKNTARKQRQKIYGCAGPPDDSDSFSDSEDLGDDVLFAPDDVKSELLGAPKTNLFGLCYKPLDRTSVLGEHINLFEPPQSFRLKETKQNLVIHGQAFGVGAFEEDDEDIYARDDMSRYDFEMEAEEAAEARKKISKKQNILAIHQIEKILDGFSLSSGFQKPLILHPPPDLPKGFSPIHISKKHRRFEKKDHEQKGLGRHVLTAQQRSALLAERGTIPVQVKSGIKQDQMAVSSSESYELDSLLEEYKKLPEASSSDFKPFAKDTQKQKRYELFLKMKQTGHKDGFQIVQPRQFTEWEKERELVEFDRASQLFAPLVSSMASRFVTAQIQENKSSLKDGLNTKIIKETSERSSDRDIFGGSVQDEDDRSKAAHSKMYGNMTQTVVDWYPDKLLCRRFNIPNPYPNSTFVGVPETKREKVSIFNFISASSESSFNARKESIHSEDGEEAGGGQEPSDANSAIEKEKEETGTPVEKPPMSLFHAIFQDSSDSSDEEEEEERGRVPSSQCAQEGISKSDANSKNDGDGNDRRDKNERSMNCRDIIIRNPGDRPGHSGSSDTDARGPLPSPILAKARGIFANVDFAELNSFRSATMDEGVPSISEKALSGASRVSGRHVTSSSSEDEDSGAYGPAPPPISPLPLPSAPFRDTYVSDRAPPSMAVAFLHETWVEKKLSHKHDKDKRHKDHKHKKKKKRKKKKGKNKSGKHTSSSSSSSSLSSSD